MQAERAWTLHGAEYDLCCTLRDSQQGVEAECSIMHESTRAPAPFEAWSIEGQTYDTAVLPCGHTFMPSAIALHFASNSMRCPVCRAGADEKLCLRSLPEAVQHELGERVAVMQRDSEQNSMEMYIDVPRLERDMTLVVELASNDRRDLVIIQTPLRHAGVLPSDSMHSYKPQHVFTRVFSRTLARMKLQDAGLKIRFCFHHPVLTSNHYTRRFSYNELLQSKGDAMPFSEQDAVSIGAISLRHDSPRQGMQIDISLDRGRIVHMIVETIRRALDIGL